MRTRPGRPRSAPLWFMNPLAWVALAGIRVYQIVVPDERKPRCRFHPSCSAYMADSIQLYGLLEGGRHGYRRLRRCSSFRPGGEDWP
jgi:hypothetical protein